jgi:hypothetical protein
VEGDQGEDRRAALEADRIWSAGKLAIEGNPSDPGLRPLRPAPAIGDDELAGEAVDLEPGTVEDEGEALVVALVVLDRVGEDHAPVTAEPKEQLAERRQSLLGLLDRDHVEALDDVLDAGEGVEIPLWRIGLGRVPFAGEIAELADVPGCDQEVAIGFLRNVAAELAPEASQLLSDRRGRGLGDRGHEQEPRSRLW